MIKKVKLPIITFGKFRKLLAYGSLFQLATSLSQIIFLIYYTVSSKFK